MTEAATDWRVHVYLRERVPPAVSETIDDALARLRALEREGEIEELRVDSWGVRGGRCADLDEGAASTLEEFESWADRADRSLAPAFDRREVSSAFCDRSVRRIDVPILSIAVYAGDRLRCVTPCSDRDRTYTVQDCIDALATGREAIEDAEATAADPIVDAGRP